MIDTRALYGRIVEKGYTKTTMANKLGITPKTFYLKMKKGVFGSDEIEKMISILDIEEPLKIFFVKK